MAEYGVSLGPGPHDYNALSHVGWNSDIDCKVNCYNDLFKQPTVNYISSTVTKYLRPMRKEPTVVCDQEIRGMITSVFNIEAGGDMPGIYTKDTFNLPANHYKRIVDIVIQSITSQIKNQYEMQECNNSLDIWNQLYGDFNKAGLRQHPKIKLRERHPQYMMFNMNY